MDDSKRGVLNDGKVSITAGPFSIQVAGLLVREESGTLCFSHTLPSINQNYNNEFN